MDEWRTRLAGAARFYISSIGLEVKGGGIYDENMWMGGFGFASLLYPTSWMPEIGGFGIYLTRDNQGNPQTVPIYGATAEIIPGEAFRFRGQGFAVGETGGGGDLRAWMGRGTGFDFVVTGVGSEELGTGIFAAARLRFLQDRLRIWGGAGWSEQEVEGETRTSVEGIGAVVVDIAQPGEELSITSVYAGAAGIATTVAPLDPAEEERSGMQVDVQAGVRMATTDWGLDATAGFQHWEAGERERDMFILGINFAAWRGFGALDTFSLGAHAGVGIVEEGETESVGADFGLNTSGTW